MTSVFGKKIREARKGLKLTLDDVAKKIKTSKGYLSDIENGKTNPPSDKLIRKLCKVLKMDRKVLLRLSHIDKIPEDIKQELHISKIITPSKYLKEKGNELSSILEEEYTKRKSMPEDYIPLIHNYEKIEQDFEEHIKNVQDYVRFKIYKISIVFALHIFDEMMERKALPSFCKGNVVFFSEIEHIHKNDFVFVIHQNQSGMQKTFRQVTESNRGKIYLKALNPRFRKETIISRKNIIGIWRAVGRLELF
ncbi:helix-turn-helix domain-containing protein [Candidatus Uabimicrobium sp. HlEnr_7]|uniref:helix-turn-helix domain-containing protein n=1 Tax=Candidatus Uabimicrobium helgolandensis TaxID=3095367 RepID=UPI003557E7A8